MKHIIPLFLAAAILHLPDGICQIVRPENDSLLFPKANGSAIEMVNPMIGTGGHGHTYPGASAPFGMVQLSPDTRLEGWDGCSAYHNDDTLIYGFSHTHLSGTGCSDYGDILLMPVTGPASPGNKSYASTFIKKSEMATPGYYRVNLLKNQVRVELTATQRAGFHCYTFFSQQPEGIVLDLAHRDRVLESGLKIISSTEIEGYRISQAWAARQIVYFVIRFSKPFKTFQVDGPNKQLSSLKDFTGKDIRALFSFGVPDDKRILVKVGISAVSTEGARKNLDTEIPGWDFASTAINTYNNWRMELANIVVKGGTREQKTVFYTALYHSLLNPNLYMDVDGKYLGRDFKVHEAKDFDYYTVFSLWDTYRATHPLLTILQQKRTNDFIRTFIRQYQEGGILPVWELSANETGCMIGYHSVPVIADAWMKGIREYDGEKALEAMIRSADRDHLGLKYYKEKGYIPGDKEGESVSKTLEYAYDDWCIAQMAQSMGKKEVYRRFIRRAQAYKNLFDPSTGFFRARMNESWFSPFDPSEVNFNYTEANAWQYAFYVPQDIDGLIRLQGGKDRFSKKLDALFTVSSKTSGREQADITGLIGQYAHGNEPSHHMAYLYDYTAEPWKTQHLVHKICRELYTIEPAGLCGNEDCGQMSSWFVLSALGFYPVTPGSNVYAIGTPLFPEATIRLKDGKSFRISAINVSDTNCFIQSASLSGKPYNKCYITHETLMAGGELAFMMGPEPNASWGTGKGEYPVSAIRDQLITPVPFVARGAKTFFDTTSVVLASPVAGTTIYYTTDGSVPTKKSAVYKEPVHLRNTAVIKAYSSLPGFPDSDPVSAEFIRIPKERKITLHTRYASQYSAGGDNALIDFIRGGENFRTGSWQGYEGADLDAVIDLGSVQQVHRVSAGFLQDQGSWIFMPTEVRFSVSSDGKTFTETGTVRNDVAETDPDVRVKEFSVPVSGVNARFIHVVAVNRKVCPEWHAGSGSKAWIFADEIIIE